MKPSTGGIQGVSWHPLFDQQKWLRIIILISKFFLGHTEPTKGAAEKLNMMQPEDCTPHVNQWQGMNDRLSNHYACKNNLEQGLFCN